ncbi:MAG: glycosyltransferase family 4 protein [Chthoniobacteraceae bacterium]
MKIGIVAPEFPPEVGGVQTYAFESARALTRLGHEVTVFCQPHPEGEVQTTEFRVEPLLTLRRRTDRALPERFKMDVWHSMNASYVWLALETAPVFATVHGNDFLSVYHPVARLDLRTRLGLPFGSNLDRKLGDWLTRRLLRRSFPRARHVFANSRFTEQKLIETHPDCAGKTSVASVGIAEDFKHIERPERAPGPTRLITVCRLSEPDKNVHIVLQALALLKADHAFHYTIVGDGYLAPGLKRLAQELGFADRVTFAGFVSKEQLKELLLASDLFVLTTSTTVHGHEGFGLVYIEANACGCPTLAARQGGAVEAVREGETGFFVDKITPSSLADAIRRFIRGEVRFDGGVCRNFALGFSWENVARHCVEFYNMALGGL